VQHQLAGLRPRGSQASSPDNVVEATLQHDDEVFARWALGAFRFFEVIAELTLQQTVGALDLLFFAQLQAVASNFGAPGLSVLTRDEVTLFDGALVRETAQSF